MIDWIAMNISDFYSEYRKWLELYRPGNLWLAHTKLSEEVGEVAETLFALFGNEKKINKLAKKGQTPQEALKEELGDVIIVALNMAFLGGILHDELFKQMQNKCIERTEEWLRKKQQ